MCTGYIFLARDVDSRLLSELVTTDVITWWHNPEGHSLNSHFSHKFPKTSHVITAFITVVRCYSADKVNI
jgi:hypothetical protein